MSFNGNKQDIYTYYHTLKSLRLVGAYWRGFYASRFVDEVHLRALRQTLKKELRLP